MSRARHMLFLLLVCLISPARAEDVAGVLAQFKETSGGSRWDAVHTLVSEGALAAGGLSGSVRITNDLISGRSRTDYTLGSIEGTDAYDGRAGWALSPGGEVAVRDAPEAIRRARTQAWVDARAYWYPQRAPARYEELVMRVLEGQRYDVVTATPDGGEPIELWFAAQSHLLRRTVERQNQDTVITTFDDYRAVNGVRLPFHIVTDTANAKGEVDARARNEVRFSSVRVNAAVPESAFTPPKMADTARIESAQQSTSVPFELIDDHIRTDIVLDGKKARVLVDTGGVNLLTPQAAQRLGIAAEGKLAASGVGEERADFSLARAKELRLGAAVLDRPVFYVIDLSELPEIGEEHIDGLVGYEIFRRFDVQIDYAKRVLTLGKPGTLAPAGATAIPFELEDRTPIIAGTLDGIPVRLTIDTGANGSLTLHAPFVREHDLVARYSAAPESIVGWGVGGPARGRPARLGTLMLGTLRIDGLVGELSTATSGTFANPDVSANLGGGLLRRFTVVFDFAAKRMYLTPNAAFGTPDSYDRSGLWLLRDEKGAKIADVAPEGASAQAGLRMGDRVVSIGGEPIGTHTIAEWHRILRERAAGTRLKVKFERDGSSRETELTLADRVPGAR